MGPRGRCNEAFLGGRFFGEVGVTCSGRRDDDATGGQPRQPSLFLVVCVMFVLVARVAECALEAVLFHDSLRGRLYQF